MTTDDGARNAPAALRGSARSLRHACRAVRSLADLQVGDHICFLYETDDEHRAVLTPYLRHGLERGEKVIYATDHSTAETVLGYLRDDGVEVERYLTRGQLCFLSRDDTYLRFGTFAAEEMLSLFRSETEKALAEGFSALRATGEMTWARDAVSGSEQLFQYEARLSEYIPGHGCLTLCQYDRRRFEPALLLDVLRTHPRAILGVDVCENPYYIPPDEFLNADPAARDLRQWTRDIVRQKQTEEALRESEANLQALLDANTQSTFLLDRQALVVATNETAARRLGLTRDALLARCVYETIPPELVEPRRAHIDRVFATGQPTRFQDLRSGRWLDHSVVPVLNGRGEVIRAAIFAEDITERRLAEEALRLSEERYRRLVETATEGIWSMDGESRTTFVNDQMARLLGYTPEEMLGRRVTDFMPPEDLADHAQKMAARIEGESTLYERRFVCKDGRMVTHLVSAAPMTDAEGRFAGSVALFTDITDRKRAEEALRESEARLRAIFETAGVALAVAAPGGQTLLWNRGTEELLGYSGPELLQVNSLEITHPDDLEKSREAVAAVLAGRCPSYRVEKRYLHKDGHPIWVDLSVTPIRGPQDEIVAVIGAATDITKRKQAEEEHRKLEQQIRQTQKMESLGILAGGIAHDFNNILMAVLGNAEMAMETISPTSAARTSLARITVAARRAADLCRQMLTYSGRAPSVQEPVNVCGLIEEMAHLLRASISKMAMLDLRLPLDLPPIHADPGQIRQVVMNLIINASEAIGDQSGVITISVSASQCDGETLRRTELNDDLPPGRYVHLEVTDTGCGMDAATQARIFEPFFTTKFTGRGLGLAAVLGIVRSHRGGLQVDSQPGRGTTFKILFPALQVSPALPGDEPSATVTCHGPGTILLADDEESLLVLGVDMLESLGFTVLTATNGREAVELYRQMAAEIDLVILDLTMPHMDGATAFRELRRLNPQVRAVLASGYVEEDVTDRCAGQGLVGILQKPYTLGRLRALLAEAIPANHKPG